MRAAACGGALFSAEIDRLEKFPSTTRERPQSEENQTMYLKHIHVSTATAVALSLSGAVLAESAADATAKAAGEMAKDVGAAAEVTQGAADVATEAAADVNAAKAAGKASSMDAEAADVASEVTNEAAAEMIEAKMVTEEVASPRPRFCRERSRGGPGPREPVRAADPTERLIGSGGFCGIGHPAHIIACMALKMKGSGN